MSNRNTHLRLRVNLRVHLRAGEREQAHSVSLSQLVLLTISHLNGFLLNYLSGDEGGSSESEGLLQGTV